MMRCHLHDLEFLEVEFWEHVLNFHLLRLEQIMTEVSSDQQRLDADVTALAAAIKAEVEALKAQTANNPGLPATALDFSGLENLITTVKADTPAVPTLIPGDDPSLVSGGTATPSTIGATAPSPFVDPEEEPSQEEPSDQEEPEFEPVPVTDPGAANAGEPEAQPIAVNDQVPAQSSEATGAPATDAESVVAPEDTVTPSTENPPTEPA